MRYLDSRDNYLKKVNERRLEKQEEILNHQYKKIFETTTGSGALGNEIPWGDSLLGRLINSTLRKVQEGINTMQMSRLTTRLKAHFDYIVGQSAIAELSDEEKQQVDVYKIDAFIRALKESVDNGDKVKEIKRICDATISGIEKIELTSEENKTKKEEILKLLKEFREWLNQFKDTDGDNDPEKESKDEGEEQSSESFYGLYPTMVKALKSLSLILAYYKKVEILTPGKEESSGKELYKYVCKGGETIEGIQKDTNINKFKLTTDQIWTINSKVLQPYVEKATKSKLDKNKLQLSKGLVLTLEVVKESVQFLFEDVPAAGTNKIGSSKPMGAGAGSDRAKVTGGEGHLKQAFAKLKRSCEILESPKEKGIGITTNLLNEITSDAVKSKKSITNLFIEINRFLVGDKKSTLNASSDKLYENVDILERNAIVAEKIARFTVRALQFDGENLYGGLGDLGKPLKQYIECINLLKKAGVPKKQEEEKKEERTLFRYKDFYKLINEAEEEENVSDQIRTYFDENFGSALDGLELSEEKAKELEEKAESLKDKMVVTINGTGPILEVMRLFNRAYKIHTKNAIPFSGRTDGKLNVATMNQWTAFGNTSGEMKGKGDGPYRNNKLFNQWENAVYDVMKDHEIVFTKGTILKIGDFVKQEAGVALRELMLDLLDGEELYKSEAGSGNAGGAQKKALNKYFGDAPGLEESKLKTGDLSVATPDGGNDLEDNTVLANEIKEKNISFIDANEIKDFPKIGKELKNSFFAIVPKDAKEIRYGYIQNIDGQYAYIAYTKRWNWFQDYLRSQNGDKLVEKKKKVHFNVNTNREIAVWGTRIQIDQLLNVLKPGLEISGLNSKPDAKPENKYNKETIDGKVYWLAMEGDENSYTLKKISDPQKVRQSVLQSRAGFENIIDRLTKGVDKEHSLITKRK